MAQAAEGQKLYQQVATTIADAIRAGRYLPGRRLPSERDLAEELQVSRPTIREAMIALEIRGLIEARAGSGIYVTDAPPVEARAPELDIGAFELTEARALFEGETAALAATAITDDQIAALERLVADMGHDPEDRRVELADRQFHVAIAEATRNSAIVGVVETLWDLRYRSPLCRAMFERARRREVNPRPDEHQAILEALRARDSAAARKAMRDHLNRVISDLLAATELGGDDIVARRSQLRQVAL